MVCVTNGNTINTNYEYSPEFFYKLREQLYFAFDVMHVERNATIVKDIVFEEKFGNQKFLNALNAQDYDTRGYLQLILDSFASITDVDETICGEATDVYSINDQQFVGDQYTFAELAYENNWYIISFLPVEMGNLTVKIDKNSIDTKEMYNICNTSQLLLCNSLKNDIFLGEFYSSFDCVYCSEKYSFEDWASLSHDKRLKVLSTFYSEITYIVHNQFQKLKRFPGKNPSRVEKIGNDLFEYRIANPNYRIYYTRDSDKLILLKGMLKRRQTIANATMKRLVELKSQPYAKIGK